MGIRDGIRAVGWARLLRELWQEVSDDDVTNGAAALAYYWLLAVFPALIVLLTVLPYLPIPNLGQAIMDLIRQLLPSEAAAALSGNVMDVVSRRNGKLLSLGLLGTIWAASSGMYAVIQEINATYDVKEGRSLFHVRGLAILLTLLFGVLVIVVFGLIVLGGLLQSWLAGAVGSSSILLTLFAFVRWIIVVAGLLLGFALLYYFGPDVKQQFQWITPGSAVGVALLLAASVGFRVYIDHFSNYNATYGSLGAVVILMLWLYVAGLVMLIGSEINALLERHAAEQGKGPRKDA